MFTLTDIPLGLRVLRFAGHTITNRRGPRAARVRRWLWNREYSWYGPWYPISTSMLRLLVNEPWLAGGRWERGVARDLRGIYHDPAWNFYYHPEVSHDSHDSNGTAR